MECMISKFDIFGLIGKSSIKFVIQSKIRLAEQWRAEEKTQVIIVGDYVILVVWMAARPKAEDEIFNALAKKS